MIDKVKILDFSVIFYKLENFYAMIIINFSDKLLENFYYLFLKTLRFPS